MGRRTYEAASERLGESAFTGITAIVFSRTMKQQDHPDRRGSTRQSKSGHFGVTDSRRLASKNSTEQTKLGSPETCQVSAHTQRISGMFAATTTSNPSRCNPSCNIIRTTSSSSTTSTLGVAIRPPFSEVAGGRNARVLRSDRPTRPQPNLSAKCDCKCG
jgi:hypothetical protein